MLTAHLADLLTILTDRGLPVVGDRRDMTTPGALLTLKSINRDTLAGTSTTWDLILVAPGVAYVALESLDRLAALVLDVVDGDLEAAAWHDPNLSPDPLPALLGTITTESE